MGDNNLVPVSKDEVTANAKKMREATEASLGLIEKLFSTSTDLGKKVVNLEGNFSKQKSELDKAKSRLAEVEPQLATLQSKISNTDTALQEFSSNLAEEKESRQKAESHASQLETEVTGLKSNISELEANVSNLETTIKEKDELFVQTVEEKDARFKNTMDDKSKEMEDYERRLKRQEEMMIGLKYLRKNINSFHLGEGELKDPCGCCMLPDGCVVVADTKEGLLLYSCNTELKKKVTSNDWKWPQGLVYDQARNRLLVTIMLRTGKTDAFERAIGEFNLELELLGSTPGPKDAGYDNVAKERLARGKKGDLYLSISDGMGSSLYKYSIDKWFLLSQRAGVTFTDVQVLGETGPISELLVVETRMGYVHKFSIRGTEICDRRSLAIVEKPGAICVDQDGVLFAHDAISGKVREIDTIRFEPKRDICIVNESIYTITASHGYLGVAVRERKNVDIFKYSDKAIVI